MAIWTAADKLNLTITLKCKNISELSVLLSKYEHETLAEYPPTPTEENHPNEHER